MSLREIGQDANGRPIFERLPFDAREYTVPPDYVPDVRTHFAAYGSRELLAMRDGPFAILRRVREIERDGKQYIILSRVGLDEWAIELELTDDVLGEIRVLTPEEAWKLARDRDSAHVPPITLATK